MMFVERLNEKSEAIVVEALQNQLNHKVEEMANNAEPFQEIKATGITARIITNLARKRERK